MAAPYRVTIVGAGLTGLALSRSLARRGVPHVVFEKDARAGGVIRTESVAGRVLEIGPQRTRLTPAIRSLIDELELGHVVLRADADLPLLIYRDGRLREVPRSVPALLRSDVLPLRSRLRLIAEPLTPRARADEDVAHALTRRFGRRAYEDVLGPLFGGLFASDPRDMLVRHALRPALRDLGAERSAVLSMLRRGFRGATAVPCSFVGGMATLTDAMHAQVAGNVRLGCGALELSEAGGEWELHTAGGRVRAPHVVLTCPAGDAARLLAGSASDASARLRALRYNPIAVVHLLSACRIPALGYQVSFAESLHTRGVTFQHALFARDGLFAAFLGGARKPELVDWSDDAIGATAAEEFRSVTGFAAAPIHVARVHVPAWDRSWTALDDLALPPGIHLAANYESRIGIPGRLLRAEALAARLAGERP